MYTLGSGEGSCAPLRTPASRATRVTLADHAAVGAAEALPLPNLGELALEAVSALGEPRIAALVRIEDLTAAETGAGRRSKPPPGGFVAFPQGSLAP